MWFGTQKGLNRYDGHTFTVYEYEPDNPSSLGSGSYIRSLYEDRQGMLWIGLLDGNNPIDRFDPDTGEWKAFGLEDGLQDLAFDAEGCHRGHTGELFFGGIGGINAIRPTDSSSNPNPPQVALTGLRLFNEPVVPGPEHIDLAYHSKRAQVPDLTVEIERDFSGDVGAVEIVPQEIGRVLLNLLGNAFDAVHARAQEVDGGYTPTVRVSTRRVAGQVEIRVSDNGPGIPSEIKDRISEPFFTTKPTGSGTGLGLSLSYDIVTQGHGGTLSVESTEGQGATFVITLPNSLS